MKLMELHKAGVKPYTELDLKNVMYWLDERCDEYKNKHVCVSWNDGD